MTSSTFVRRAASDLRLVVCAALLSILGGCFRDPDISKLTCNQPKGCPTGSTCSPNGKCCKSADGIICDGVDAATSEVQNRSDSSATDTGRVSPIDGQTVDSNQGALTEAGDAVALDSASGTGGIVGTGGNAVSFDAIGAGGVGGGAGSGGGGSSGSGGSFDARDTGGAGGAAPIDAPVDVRIVDVSAEAPAVDAPGTCSVDKDCPAQTPLCLANRCAKCSADADCVGRAGPACSATTGTCVACTGNKYCAGVAATCDTATNQCVGCVKRSDCPASCQTCTSGVCTAVKNQDDPGVCAGTCDATGACKAKKGQTCQSVAGGCLTGTTCSPDGICCDKSCTGSCEACDITTALGTCTTIAANEAPHTRHTACAGTGTCGGKCDGTSAACFYPTAACGTATCTSSSFQAAGTCSAGTCSLPAAKTCQYGCATALAACACPPGFTGPNCDLSRFVVITPSTVAGYSAAFDTNADGTVVTGNQGGYAFIWTQAAGALSLGPTVGLASSVGNGINADGTVIVGQAVSSSVGATQEAFRWTRGTGMVPLSSSGTADEAALSVSGDGSIVVGYTDRFGSGTVPFRWTGAAGLGQMAIATGATATRALAISKGGTTVLGTTYNGVDNTGDVGIVWSGSAAGQVLNLPIGYLDTQAVAVTSDGSTVFGFYQAYAGPGIPFKWTPSAGAVNLVQSALNIWGVADVSGDGTILIGDGGSTGYVWDLNNGPPRLLADILVAEGANLGAATLYPYAISDDGNVIVGRASTGVGGTSSAFLARWR